ncbi:MAG: hypothetical protein ABF289_02060, partial [Clostridiales bacterium]
DTLTEIECDFLFGRVSVSISKIDNAVTVYDRAIKKLNLYLKENKTKDINHRLKFISIESVVGYFDYGDFEKSLNTIENLENILNMDFLQKGYLNIWKARVFCCFSMYNEALSIANTTREKNLKFSSSTWLELIILGVMSIINEDLGSYEVAKNYRKEALAIARSTNDKWIITDILVAEARSEIIRNKIENIESVYSILNEANKLSLEADFKHNIVLSLSFISLLLIKNNDINNAIEKSEKAIKLLEKYKYFPNCDEEEIFLNHAFVLKRARKIQESKIYAEKCIDEIKRKSNLIRRYNYKELFLSQNRIKNIQNKIEINWGFS